MSCSDPQRSMFIYLKRLNRISDDGVRVIFLIAKDLEVVTVEAIQAFISSKPDEALVILNYIEYFVW